MEDSEHPINIIGEGNNVILEVNRWEIRYEMLKIMFIM